MKALDIRGTALALLVGVVLGAWSAWQWQDNAYARVLAEQAEAHRLDRETAAVAALEQLDLQQTRRRELEDRLQANDQTHYKELKDAQQAQSRLRDRLTTADLRLSVLLDASTGCDSGVSATTGAGSVVHGVTRAELDPAHARRIISITDYGDQGLIALKACQAYIRDIHR